MKFKRLPDLTVLNNLFSWDETGSLKWKTKIANCVKIGSEAGTQNKKGYWYVCINNNLYLKHRILYSLYHNENLNDILIDHKDNNPNNNNKDNLRKATRSNNNTNQNKRKDNTSGCKGVSFHSHSGKWLAKIQINKQQIILGYFKSYIYACVVRKRAAKEIFGHWRRD